jgi:hypothetical protein
MLTSFIEPVKELQKSPVSIVLVTKLLSLCASIILVAHGGVRYSDSDSYKRGIYASLLEYFA